MLPARPDTRFGKDITARNPYLIDFEFSQILKHRPGRQPAIELPPSLTPKPDGISRLDPYSWDVYCFGWVMRGMVERHFRYKGKMPWYMRWYLGWIIGEAERGCEGICHCRPTAAHALRVLQVIGWYVGIRETIERALAWCKLR
ncbi:uncharacterized protein BXZ73DRAFT_38695 [Epithele typhae]|uniref:uncharacterized protein n=1 Tax=Epithele typhae TaxID=378194 RepID=UPI002008E51D|nr:uncharacterized protein BXZ73DRAFT_38695 [Epithele typhae]KAH9944963.1 hypothetical protein BXZ73DRAFT_38695 [Epithele typhae]